MDPFRLVVRAEDQGGMPKRKRTEAPAQDSGFIAIGGVAGTGQEDEDAAAGAEARADPLAAGALLAPSARPVWAREEPYHETFHLGLHSQIRE